MISDCAHGWKCPSGKLSQPESRGFEKRSDRSADRPAPVARFLRASEVAAPAPSAAIHAFKIFLQTLSRAFKESHALAWTTLLGIALSLQAASPLRRQNPLPLRKGPFLLRE